VAVAIMMLGLEGPVASGGCAGRGKESLDSLYVYPVLEKPHFLGLVVAEAPNSVDFRPRKRGKSGRDGGNRSRKPPSIKVKEEAVNIEKYRNLTGTDSMD
jgi:hypothetical protein